MRFVIAIKQFIFHRYNPPNYEQKCEHFCQQARDTLFHKKENREKKQPERVLKVKLALSSLSMPLQTKKVVFKLHCKWSKDRFHPNLSRLYWITIIIIIAVIRTILVFQTKKDNIEKCRRQNIDFITRTYLIFKSVYISLKCKVGKLSSWPRPLCKWGEEQRRSNNYD